VREVGEHLDGAPVLHSGICRCAETHGRA
jgi:hypothetical protein